MYLPQTSNNATSNILGNLFMACSSNFVEFSMVAPESPLLCVVSLMLFFFLYIYSYIYIYRLQNCLAHYIVQILYNMARDLSPQFFLYMVAPAYRCGAACGGLVVPLYISWVCIIRKHLMDSPTHINMMH